jgi:hypothetical protein
MVLTQSQKSSQAMVTLVVEGTARVLYGDKTFDATAISDKYAVRLIGPPLLRV